MPRSSFVSASPERRSPECSNTAAARVDRSGSTFREGDRETLSDARCGGSAGEIDTICAEIEQGLAPLDFARAASGHCKRHFAETDYGRLPDRCARKIYRRCCPRRIRRRDCGRVGKALLAEALHARGATPPASIALLCIGSMEGAISSRHPLAPADRPRAGGDDAAPGGRQAHRTMTSPAGRPSASVADIDEVAFTTCTGRSVQ